MLEKALASREIVEVSSVGSEKTRRVSPSRGRLARSGRARNYRPSQSLRPGPKQPPPDRPETIRHGYCFFRLLQCRGFTTQFKTRSAGCKVYTPPSRRSWGVISAVPGGVCGTRGVLFFVVRPLCGERSTACTINT